MSDFENRVLITGADGFIGKSVCKMLEASGFSVIKLTNVRGGVTSAKHVFEFPKSKNVIHLAGKHYVPDSWDNPSDFYNVNVVGTQNVINYCLKHDATLTYASTYLYGNPKFLPISENHPTDCVNPYALSKNFAEELIRFNQRHSNLRANILRLFNVYGPFQKNNYLIPKLISQARDNIKYTVHSLEPKRDYIFVDDVAKSIKVLLQSEKKGLVLNIGSGQSYSVKEIVNTVQSVSGVHNCIQTTGLERMNEITNVIADNQLAFRELGWRPEYDLEAGIKRIWSSVN